jgi:hypothetical protein
VKPQEQTSSSFGKLLVGAIGVAVGVLLVRSALTRARRKRPAPAPGPRAPGGRKTQTTQAIELVARMLQTRGPLEQFRLYLVAFRPLRDDPRVQSEVHLYCHFLNDDFAQCVVFDGRGPSARLIGVEYRISERLYDRLSAEEQAYWHPSNYELLSAQVVAPGLPPSVERELVRLLLNGYGKTWQLWSTDASDRPNHSLPFGDPRLAWSFNHDGELDPHVVASRDARIGVDADRRRVQREALRWLAAPQGGEDLLRDRFAEALDSQGREREE